MVEAHLGTVSFDYLIQLYFSVLRKLGSAKNIMKQIKRRFCMAGKTSPNDDIDILASFMHASFSIMHLALLTNLLAFASDKRKRYTIGIHVHGVSL